MMTIIQYYYCFIALLLLQTKVFANDDDTPCTCTAPDDTSCQAAATTNEESSNTISSESLIDDNDNGSPVSSCQTITCITDWFAQNHKDFFETKPLLVSNQHYTTNTNINWTFDDILDKASSGGLTWTSQIMAMNQGVKEGDSKIFQMSPQESPGTVVTREALEAATQEATLLLGTTHAIEDGAAQVVQAFQDSLQLPASINTYITRSGFDHAAPLHTDRFHTFVLQVSGSKRWKVYQPLVKNPTWGVHGYAEWAKGGNPIYLDQVGPLLVDHVMQPGDILYFPRGSPHETATANNDSVALTVAVHTDSFHLVYEKLLRCIMSTMGFFDQPPPVACPICDSTLTDYVRSEEGAELRQSLPLIPTNSATKDTNATKEEYVKQVVGVILRHFPNIAKYAMHKDEDMAKTYFTPEKLEEIAPTANDIAEFSFDERSVLLNKLQNALATHTKDVVARKDQQAHWNNVFSNSPVFAWKCHRGGMRALFSDYNFEERGLEVFI